MPRPVSKQGARRYGDTIATLTRLRTALILEGLGSDSERERVIGEIDTLTRSLSDLMASGSGKRK